MIKINKRNSTKQIILNLFFTVICALIAYPFVLMVMASVTPENELALSGYKLIPKAFSLEAYRYVLSDPMAVLNGYKVTAITSIATMVLSVLFMAATAYPLARSGFKGKKFVSFYLFFTMLFSGGLVPSYILITQYLKLTDTYWVHILPSLMNVWYIFMMRTFMQDIPGEIFESAEIDGASEFLIFFRIVIPLAKPVMATIALFMFLGKWNDWMTSMLYINDQNLISLQYLLQRVLKEIQLVLQNQNYVSNVDLTTLPSETARMAMAIIVAGPALFVFPFFQKYFVKGLTVGSVKG